MTWRGNTGKDRPDGEWCTPDGRLPNADMGTKPGTIAHIRDIFYRMGMNDQVYPKTDIYICIYICIYMYIYIYTTGNPSPNPQTPNPKPWTLNSSLQRRARASHPAPLHCGCMT